MTVSTTISSTSVNPRSAFISPVPVLDAVQADAVALREDVVDVLAGLRVVRGTLVAAQAPVLPAERVGRDAAQEIDPRGLRVLRVGHALDERLQRGRIARLADVARDAAFVEGALVRVDAAAQLAQRLAQVALLGALPAHLGERQRHGGEQRHDRHRDDQLDQREAAALHCLSAGGLGPAAGGCGGYWLEGAAGALAGAAGAGAGAGAEGTGGGGLPP